MSAPFPDPSSRSDWTARMREVMIRGSTAYGLSAHDTTMVQPPQRKFDLPVALNALSHVVPGIPRISVQASGTESTLLVTARPMAMATTAEMTIWAADPGSLMGCHHGFLGSTTGVPETSWKSSERVRQVSRVSPVSISLPISQVQDYGSFPGERNEISLRESSGGDKLISSMRP